MSSDLAAGLAAGLKGLKKTVTVDHSKPSVSGFVSASDVAAYQAAAQAYNIERYIDALRDVTFRTAFCPLTPGDAHTLMAAYAALHPDKLPHDDTPASHAKPAAVGKLFSLTMCTRPARSSSAERPCPFRARRRISVKQA